MSEDFDAVVAGKVDDNTIVITSNEVAKQWFENAMATYDPSNRMYSAYLNYSGSANQITQDVIETLGESAQTNLDNIKKINDIIRKEINTDDLIGMVVQSITNNINTDYRLSYKNFGEQRNKLKTLAKAKAIIEDFNKQINIEQLIRDSIDLTYCEGNYICGIRNSDSNWILDYYPLGIAELSGYTENGKSVIVVNIDKLKESLQKTMIKTRKGKSLFFKDTEEEIKNSYPSEVYQAYKDKETYARLDTSYTGVIRINNRSRKYGLSPIFRALSPTIMLKTFRDADTISAKSKSKKIIHQIMRKELLGQDGKSRDLELMVFSHGEFMKAFRNDTVVYTSNAGVEKIVYVEPHIEDISVDKVNIYRNKVLSSLGVAFLANDKSQTASTANISFKQLLQCINSISEQVERMIESFYETVLTVNNIGLEYKPSISIIDAEMLEEDMRIELSKLLYTTFNCSRETSLGVIGIDLEDEISKREQENNDGISDIFTPYITSYNSGGKEENNGGRPAGEETDKSLDDKEYNKTRQ